MTCLKEETARTFWVSPDIGYSFSNSRGMSGGLLILWKEEKVEVISSFKGDGFLGIKVIWKGDCYYVVNVYSSCESNKKRILWNELLRLKDVFVDGEWILGGDFNVIKERRERKGRSGLVNHLEAGLFEDVINKSLLVDVPCKGKKFSWYSGDGKFISRIDRVLVAANVKEWLKFKVKGRGDFVLKEKLRLLKDKLREWNRDVFSKYDLEMEEGVRDLNWADGRLEVEMDADLIGDIVEKRREASSRIWRNLKIKENMILQKSRLRWIKEGDANKRRSCE
ncbi:uncharacterized protein LOC131626563 [Vicia villosa]|uniref:uncharacterized protein LOC131626563 n=1 Tax=Vicia villosa TaxID=3911 RepID=UPI00273B7A44|nr:uncharacterized protein LOC131626563 [Vicia villosa]